jgi:hypothetical protein
MEWQQTTEKIALSRGFSASPLALDPTETRRHDVSAGTGATNTTVACG